MNGTRASTVSSTVNPNAIDLDVSRLSQGSYSSVSTVTIGGSHYPVGTKIGSSGLFVIGDPSTGSQKRSRSSQSVSTTYSISQLINSKGYTFEDWNWTAIRFSCFILVLAVMIGLLAATIGLVVAAKDSCFVDWEWWQGGVIYRINVNEFYDQDRDNVGDLQGLENRLEYLQYLGISIVSLSNFLPSLQPSFDQVIKFDDVDDRMGTSIQLQNLVNLLQSRGIRVILEMDLSHTSFGHEWFEESRGQSSSIGELYSNYYVWNNMPGSEKDMWHFDEIRNQYYCHLNDTTRPVLNWDNGRVQIAFMDVFEFWLRKGIDGFHIHGIEKFRGDNCQLISDNTILSLLLDWNSMLDKHTDRTKRVLMVPDTLLKRIQSNSPHLMAEVNQNVHLVDYPFIIHTANATLGLTKALDGAGAWQGTMGSPWVAWRWSQMTKLSMDHWASLELALLTLPGTVSISAGQEIGRDPEFRDLDGRNRLILWADSTVDDKLRPYEQGSILDISKLAPLTVAIKLRLQASALRSNGEQRKQDAQSVKKHGYAVLDTEGGVFLMERYFAQQDMYYYMSNFGNARATKDWSQYSASGLIEVDTTGLESGSLQFDEVVIEDGHARLVKVPRWLHIRDDSQDLSWKK